VHVSRNGTIVTWQYDALGELVAKDMEGGARRQAGDRRRLPPPPLGIRARQQMARHTGALPRVVALAIFSG
jgi:YD repeat-containing protein